MPPNNAPGWQSPLERALTGTAPQPAAQPAAQGQVYWVGQDGNVYLKNSSGKVSNQGRPINLMEGGFDTGLSSAEATRIDDPNPIPNAPTNLLGGGGGGGQTYRDTTAARNATQVSLDSLDTILNNALTGADEEYRGVTGAYDVEDAANLAKYQGDVQKNEINRDSNTQAALLAAARGSRGLYATLASLGALSGTGRQVANRAVATEANADLGESEKSFDTNVENLFNARSEVEKKEKQRRLDAEKILKDTRQSAEFENLKGKQELSKEMANLWTEAGNTGEASNWLNRSSTYTPQMAAKTRVNPARYAKEPLSYSTPEMNKYLSGMNSTAVNVAGGSPINGALYTSTKKRDELA